MLPARFRDVSFDSFVVAPDRPSHAQLRDRVREFFESIDPTPRRFWQRNTSSKTSGLFLVGPPGVGKTHLLAAGYQTVEESKLFASFDELVAAAGPLGMQRLSEIASDVTLVCVDEVVLEDPGNIMMLVTLLRQMADNGTNVVATANMPPQEAGGHGGWMTVFERELGSIASMFEVARIEGEDRRLDSEVEDRQASDREGSIVATEWTELANYLRTTHPMYDAGWLEQVRRIEIAGRVTVPDDKDQALRFVRFIDRVYDRQVALSPHDPAPSPDELVAPLRGDPRYVWHVARGRSRLAQLLR